MTKRNRLLDRLLSNPRDFSWQELIQVLAGLGYQLAPGGKKANTRMHFIHTHYPPIILRKSATDTTLKRYQIEAIINLSKQENLL